jgi:hypothetical protein
LGSLYNPSGRLGNTFGRCPVFANRLDDSATPLDDINNSDNSRFPFERGKDFNEDRPDARSSCPDANLRRIELRCF